MIENVLWSNCIITISVLLTIWYLIIRCKFYYDDLKQRISDEQKMQCRRFDDEPDDLPSLEKDSLEDEDLPFRYTLRGGLNLAFVLLEVIKESAKLNFSNEELQNFIRLLLVENYEEKYSDWRDIINQILVLETEKYPEFVLNYCQVDALWEDTLR